MKLFTAVAVAAVLGAVSTVASAAPITQTCGQFTAGAALSCVSGTGVNDSASGIDSAYPGSPSWSLFDKDDAPGESDNDFYLTDADSNPFDPGNDTSGFFYLSNTALAAGNQFVLVLKGGNGDPRWAAFLLDLLNLNQGSGIWSTRQGLSHASLYYRNVTTNGGGNGGTNGGGNGGTNGGTNGGDPGNGGGNGGSVPEPASMSLIGLGLAGAAVLRRRK